MILVITPVTSRPKRQEMAPELGMKRLAITRTNGSVRPLAATTAALLFFLLRCSEAFVVPPSTSSGGGGGGVTATSTATAVAAAAGTRAEVGSNVWDRMHGRRERMATLGQVRWACSESSSNRGCGGAAKMRAAAGGGVVRKGLGRVGRAVARVFRRGSPAAAAAAASGVSRSNAAGAAPPPTDATGSAAAVDVDDIIRQSQLLLRDDEDGAASNKRVLILMSDTGGGHRASAQALKAAFDELYPGAIDVDIVDLWTTHAPWPFNKFVEAYQFMAKRPPIWKAFWEYGRFPLTRKITDEVTNVRVHKRFRSMIEEYDPDLVVSVHPLCQEIPLRVMKNLKKKADGGSKEVPFVTVVTDLGGAHPTWFHRDVDACFVPSERLAVLAQKCGLSPDQVRLHGLPVRPGFWGERSDSSSAAAKQEEQEREQREQRELESSSSSSSPSATAAKAALQEKLGLKPGVKACLVVGGGDGVGGLRGIADSVGHKLGQQGAETQVVVVCGTNDVVRTSLEQGNWASNVHMHVKGFVSNMDEWMGAVDCIVTKAGPGTIAEAMIRGLPIMLSAFLPGQEAGNVPFVTEGGFGAFSKDPAKIADTVSRWLQDDELLAEMSSKAKEASRPQATYKICADIGEMLFGAGVGTRDGNAASASIGQGGASPAHASAAGLSLAA